MNLGGFSLWLDEILQTLQARGSLAEAWAALGDDPDHPPLDGLISWLALHLGAGETGHRLIHVGWGVATGVLLASWAWHRWSPRCGVLVGLLAATSPFHVRYSQEVRPYALSLLLVVVALRALDRLLDPPAPAAERRSWVALTLASVGVVWASTLASLFLAVTAAAWLLAHRFSSRVGERRAGRPGLRPGLGWAAAAVVLLASLPLWPKVVALLGRTPEAPAETWTLAALGRRWQALTVSGREGAALDAGGVILLLLAVAGAAVAARSALGRRWLIAALASTVGVELALLARGHWSNARYDLYGWPFLILLAAVAVDSAGGLVARRTRRRGAAVAATAALAAAALTGQLRGLYTYYEQGRPHWDRVADLVDELAESGAPLVASNEWTRISLAYYLEGKRNRDVRSVDGDPATVERMALDRGCALLTISGYPQHPLLEQFSRRQTLLARFAETEASVYLVKGGADPCPVVLPFRFRRESRPRSPWGLLTRPWHPPIDDRALDFDRATGVNLLAGWSTFETDPDGTSFVWAAAEEASLALELASVSASRLELRVWPLVVPGEAQTLEVLLDGRSIRAGPLAPVRQTLTVPLPAGALHRGENVLHLRFRYAAIPPDGRDPRRLAVAFDRLQLLP